MLLLNHTLASGCPDPHESPWASDVAKPSTAATGSGAGA